jgi:hypothetical protein
VDSWTVHPTIRAYTLVPFHTSLFTSVSNIINYKNKRMSKRLTQEEFCEKVYECVGDKYTVIGKY